MVFLFGKRTMMQEVSRFGVASTYFSTGKEARRVHHCLPLPTLF